MGTCREKAGGFSGCSGGVPEERVISQNFGQFMVEGSVKVPQELFSERQHGA